MNPLPWSPYKTYYSNGEYFTIFKCEFDDPKQLYYYNHDELNEGFVDSYIGDGYIIFSKTLKATPEDINKYELHIEEIKQRQKERQQEEQHIKNNNSNITGIYDASNDMNYYH